MAKASKQRFLEIGGLDLPDTPIVTGNNNEAGEESNIACGEKQNGNVEFDDKTGDSLTSYTQEPVNLSRVRAKRSEAKRSRTGHRTLRKSNRAAAAARAPGEHVTFSPGEDERQRLVAILSRHVSDRERRALIKRLGKEFTRIYKRHRSEVDSTWWMDDKEQRDAETAGRLCLLKGVTPSQLIEYWQGEIQNFTGMRFPTLHFLASAGNVDQVAVTLVQSKKPKKHKHNASVDRPEIHGYSGDLDPRLRPGLQRAGCDLVGFSDRSLLTVQTTAQTIARGRDVFVSSKLRPLVDWAVKNLFGVKT